MQTNYQPNNYTQPKRKKWLLVVVVMLLLIIPLFFVLNNKNNPPRSTEPTEISGPGEVVIDNTNGLRDVLLKSQYAAVYDELINYIEARVAKDTEHAYISAGPQIQPNGNLTFDVTVDAPPTIFTVIVDRTKSFESLGFSVPKSDYNKTLGIYQQQEDGE